MVLCLIGGNFYIWLISCLVSCGCCDLRWVVLKLDVFGSFGGLYDCGLGECRYWKE